MSDSDAGFSLAMHIEPENSWDYPIPKQSFKPKKPTWVINNVEIYEGKVVSLTVNGELFLPAKSTPPSNTKEEK